MRAILDIHATIDEMLAEFPPAARMRASAEILTTLLRMNRETEQAITDQEAARLLPLGASVVMEIQGCCKATAYNRSKRGNQSKQFAAG
jgi:hypothetical protein